MSDFFSFRKMIAPVVIQIIFWLGVIACIGAGLFVFSVGDSLPTTGYLSPKTTGLMIIILGPIGVRVYCEILIVFFRIHDTLRQIERNTTPKPGS